MGCRTKGSSITDGIQHTVNPYAKEQGYRSYCPKIIKPNPICTQESAAVSSVHCSITKVIDHVESIHKR
jgi:hypothetical protein